ncbi:MAG: M20 family metallopeptidase [Acidimicrobiia bacterium]
MDSMVHKDETAAYIRSISDQLLHVSHQIHSQPELAFGEYKAHDLACDTLEAANFEVTRHAFGLETAFSATAGTSGPTIAILCEYDALPEIGHACGHNIIAASGLGAAMAVAQHAEALGGRVVVLGTPAEEGGGGKVFMARQGAFTNVDAAMMIHPADHDLDAMSTIAVQPIRVSYKGQESHAAAHPEAGRNALDAAVLGYMNVAALRQHIAPHERVHGIFTNGGAKPNIVPASAETLWYIRSGTLTTLAPLKERVFACLEAGALAAGCEMQIELESPAFADMIDNRALLNAFTANAKLVGRTYRQPEGDYAVVGSTDMGNVSYLVPSIHPMVKVAPAGVSIHTPEFALHAGSEAGDRAVIDGAIMMAATVIDLWTQPNLLVEATEEYRKATSHNHPPVM